MAETTINRYDNTVIRHNSTTFKNNVMYSFADGGMNIIGNAFFLNFEDVIFDLKEKCIYLRNEKERYDPFPDDVVFGAGADNKIHIVYIKTSGEYYRQGFRVGDIIALQDKALEQQLLNSPCEALAILRKWKSSGNTSFKLSKE